MRNMLACSLVALGMCAAAPAMAQGVYIGPGGVGVDTGIRHHYGYDRERWRDHDRGYYEGRSAYREGYHRRYRDDE